MALVNRFVYFLRYVPIYLIIFYKYFFSPLFPMSCRFYPTCSAYAIEAFKRYGIVKGFFLTVARLLRCHPFYPGGYDPVK